MSDVDTLATRAMRALSEGKPEEAQSLLEQALGQGGPRADLKHALGVTLLQAGEAEKALPLVEEAIEEAWRTGAPPEFITGATLTLAAVNEDLDRPLAALAAYDKALEGDAEDPRAMAGRAHLLLAMGRTAEGLEALDAYVAAETDEDEYLEAAKELAATIRRFEGEKRQPRDILMAHRESYVDFFDEKAEEMAAEGWIAEAARMKRAPDGRVVPSIPEGARPYAAVRVDLVDPQTGRVGQVGDQPMVVALADFEPLARAAVLFAAEGVPFDLRVSSQCPWDQLPISVLLHSGDAEKELEGLFADWYTAGFEGRYGQKEAGRLHYISDPEPKRGRRGVTFTVDLGRANLLAVEDLVDRLLKQHLATPIAQVLFGRGHLAE